MWRQVSRDHQLALQLQAEMGVENKYVVDEKIVNSPDLELSDPTPDVHSLFIQFNHRFFWGRLASVVVRWSKRMYSCAGICRYKGREGFCDIALSEPLLKLRPRKNLVETLLHEMIHAYLFIADNDRDRDGHGPKFHEHMYRINREANVNITVYHTFRDEVDLYKTHWWRCEGPCRDRRPFFGTVRRSSNRAPGPNDFWWQKHLSSCGGNFIKIKEPEKNAPKAKNTLPKIKNTPPETSKDIRTFFDKTNNETPKNKPNIGPNRSAKKFKPNEPVKNPKVSSVTKRNNENLNNVNVASTASRPSTSNAVLETVRNHWLNKYNQTTESVNKIKTNKGNDNQTIKTPTQKSKNPTNKPSEKNYKPTQGGLVDTYNTIIQDLYGKDVVLKPEHFKSPPVDDSKTYYSKCPVCDISISNSYLETHISTCIEVALLNNNTDFEEPTPAAVVDLTHLSESPQKSNNNLKTCPTCNEKIHSDFFDEHLEDCLNRTFAEESLHVFESDSDHANTSKAIYLSDDDDEKNIDKGISRSSTEMPCPCCLNFVEESLMNSHLDMCLS
ncbi:DNA-dependent metalloprotease SPRTN [Arctopsyche grandis]|uniref:DNA-dependent metalloprotease SPRTN n=1 Tax=Arctopsyche grandis TaxID=121162 RepID=UPI00406D7267